MSIKETLKKINPFKRNEADEYPEEGEVDLREIPKERRALSEDSVLHKWLKPAAVVVVALASFGLGRLSVYEEKKPLTATMSTNKSTAEAPIQAPATVVQTAKVAAPATIGAATAASAGNAQSTIVGAKTTKKYHYTWCSGAARIKEENKVYFASITEAKAAGYVPAANCPGLQ